MKKNGVEFKSHRTLKQRLHDRGITGVGDLIAVVAQPVARMSDTILHTNLKECIPCKTKQKSFNQKFPI